MIDWLFKTPTGILGKISDKFLETNKDKLDAKSNFLKTIDPNGTMRVAITYGVFRLFTYQTIVLTSLIILNIPFNSVRILEAISSLVELYKPVATAFGLIVSASFCVNMMNSYKGK